ncbi:MAG: ParB/RepB/Spo0J family partition protein [Flexibacteraceae bacterium]
MLSNPIIKKKGGLGKGLGALLGSEVNYATGEAIDTPQQQVNHIAEIAIEYIQTNPFQPREHFDAEALQELADSIKVHGIIQPITLRRLSEKEYQLISGERRFQASKLAGLESIPAYIRTANDQQMLEMALIENIQRENLNAIEIALSYQRMLSELDMKQEELGDRVGKKRTTVNNYLRLLRLPPEIQVAVRDGKLSMGHARALISIENIADQLYVYKQVLMSDLSVRATEDLVRRTIQPKNKEVETKKSGQVNPEILQVQTKLSQQFGTKIKVKNSEGYKGEISIPYHNLDDLNRILEILEK